MWCGYGCPQTVYMEFLFRPVETFLEGVAGRIVRFNAAPWTLRKIAIKTVKWGVWLGCAILMASTFVAYFVGWGPLAHGLATQPLAWKGALFAIAFLTAAILFDFGWFRDQMCTIACPYGRLQNVIADQDTIVVAYDRKRGEPRRQLKQRDGATVAGDCVDCGRCVAVCPTGTDIRRGLQIECIGTALCVDACDDVMRKIGKPIGLIRYTSQREQDGGTRRLWNARNLVYVTLMVVAWGAFTALVFTRAGAQVEFLRGGREPYRLLTTGRIANQQRIRFTNQLDQPQRFTVEVVSPAGASLVLSDSPVLVDPAEVVTINAVTTIPRRLFDDGQATVHYRVRSDKGFAREYEFLALGPYGHDGGHE
jgi:cytochrome c oxidase accessory protein FixG